MRIEVVFLDGFENHNYRQVFVARNILLGGAQYFYSVDDGM